MATRANSRAQSDGRAAARPARAAAGNVRVRSPVPGPGAAGGLLSGAVNLLAGQIKGFVPPADLDERDSDYIRETPPGLWLLASMYFRADVRGLHHIPKTGPVLLVGNHSGGMTTPDTLVFTLAFSTFFGVERRFYQLAHNM